MQLYIYCQFVLEKLNQSIAPRLKDVSHCSRSRHPNDRHRDRDFEDERDYGDRDRPYKDRNRERERGRNSRDRRPSSRDRDRYYDNYDDRTGSNRGDTWQPNRPSAIQDGYYPPPADIQQGYQNRYCLLMFLFAIDVLWTRFSEIVLELMKIHSIVTPNSFMFFVWWSGSQYVSSP